MPTKDGTLVDSEQDQIAEAINSRVPDPTDPCPNCKKPSSEVLPKLSRRILYAEPGKSAPTSYLPVAATFCRNCGFVREFVLEILGVDFRETTIVAEDLPPEAVSVGENENG